MITFRPMPVLASRRSRRLRHVLVYAALCGGALAAVPGVASAQLTLTHTEDASPIPAGTLRFRIIPGWSRYDSRFTSSGTRSFDDEISTDSLGPRQLPLLA